MRISKLSNHKQTHNGNKALSPLDELPTDSVLTDNLLTDNLLTDNLLTDNLLTGKLLITEDTTHYKSIYHSESPKEGSTNQVYYLDDELTPDKAHLSNASKQKRSEININTLITTGCLWSAEPTYIYPTNESINNLTDQIHPLKTKLPKTDLQISNTEDLLNKEKDSSIKFTAKIYQPICSRKDKNTLRVGSCFGIPEIDKVFKDYFPPRVAGLYTSLETQDCINEIGNGYRQYHYGFPLGTIHTWHPLSLAPEIDVPHGLTIVTTLARNAIDENPFVFWIGNTCWPTPYAFLLPTGINKSLIDRLYEDRQVYSNLFNSYSLVEPKEDSAHLKTRLSGERLVKRSIFLNPKEGKETLSCIESCLTSTSGNIVIAYISKTTGKHLGFATARRLSIAARESNTLGYLLCQDPIQDRSFSFNSSWGVKTITSSDSTQCWQLTLHKIKGALPELREWRITLNSNQAKLTSEESRMIRSNAEPISTFATN